MENPNLDMYIITETHLRNDEILNITPASNLTCHLNNRKDGERKGGGIAAIWKNDKTVKNLKSCSNHSWYEYKNEENMNFIIGVTYMYVFRKQPKSKTRKYKHQKMPFQ